MRTQRTENREQRTAGTKSASALCSLFSVFCSRRASRGFTLIETLVAITVLITALVSPMLLTERALTSAYYARDQITAYYLAQEAIEQVRQVRDHNIMLNLQGNTTNLFAGIRTDGVPFRVDATVTDPSQSPFSDCASINSTTHLCTDPLKTDSTVYGYGGALSQNTKFIRSVVACYVQQGGDCTSAPSGEVRVTVTVSWTSTIGSDRSFTISEDMYRWVNSS